MLEEQGNCATCGFLSIRARTILFSDHHEVFEAEPEDRRRGGLFLPPDVQRTRTDCAPYCFVGARDIVALVREVQRTIPDQNRAVLQVINTDVRDCPRWFRYQPHSTPQEHLARWDVQELERHRQEWAASEATARREWEAEQEHQRREWQKGEESARQAREDEREEARKRFEERLQTQANGIQKDLVRASLGGLAVAIVAIVVSVWATANFADTTVEGPTVIVGGTEVASPQSTPDTSSDQQ